jgi:hypothetical protein
MQLDHLIVLVFGSVFVAICLYQLWLLLAKWIRTLQVPPDPWDAILSLWRKETPAPPSRSLASGMRRLLTAKDFSGIDVQLLKGLLEQEGILCTIKNEYLSIAIGDIPPAECYQELWLLDADDYPRAKEILDSWNTVTPLPTGEDDAGISRPAL